MIYFFIFFNKCSFWNLLLQIKCGTVPTVGGETGKRGRGGGLPFLCLHCTCVYTNWMTGCVNVCASAYECRRTSEQPFWFSTIHLCLFFCMFLHSCWGIWQERTLHGALDGLFLFFKKKGNGACNFDCCDQLGAKLTQSGTETGISCLANLCF